MKKIIHLIALAFMLLAFTRTATTQTIDLFNLDYTDFPNISAEFYAFDRNNQQIYDFQQGNLVLTENGIERQITNISCPQTEPLRISSVLTLDISSSMLGYRMQMARNAARAWVQAMDLNNSECAITTFNDYNFFNIDFSQDEDELNEAINKIGSYGGTSFNAGFIDSTAGALLVAERGKYKRIIVFLTDGISEGDQAKIIQQAKSIQATVYSVIIGMGAPDILKNISNATGGLWFDYINDEEQIKKVFLKILKDAQNSGPCTIEWLSDYECERNRDITLTMITPYATDEDGYLAPENSVPYLENDPGSISFGKVPPPATIDTTLVIKAVNSGINIQSINVSDPHFSITDHGGSPPPYILDKDDTREIGIRFTPADSSMIYGRLEINSDACSGNNIYLSGGFPGIGNKNSLKVLHPNGGESFGIGIDTVIKWDGVLPSDTVLIDFSTDGGASWMNITENGTGLRHDWNVPNFPSSNCLAKIEQKGLPEISEYPAQPIPLDGLLAYYPFCNGAEDKSGNDNDGDTTGTSPIEDRFDQYNSAIYFDGVDDEIRVENKGNFNLTEWTFACWVNIHTVPKNFTAIIQKDENSQQHYNYALIVDKERRIRAQYETCTQENDHRIASSQKTPYEWIHVANVRDNSTGDFILYIDGIEEKRLNSDDVPCINPDDLRIGVMTYKDNPRSPEYFNGAVDDMFIYDRPLDADEILQLFNAGPVECQPFRMADTSDALWEIRAPEMVFDNIDMGEVIIGELKDSIITAYIENNENFDLNIENISFSGSNPSDFEVISPVFPMEVKTGEIKDVEFRFEPTAVGLREAIIEVRTAYASFNNHITGTGIIPEIELGSKLIDFGKVIVGDAKDTSVSAVITNNSNNLLTITDVRKLTPDSVQFEILSGGGIFELLPDESREMELRFAPGKAGRTSGRLAFYYDGSGSPAIVNLYGEGIRYLPEIIAPPLDFRSLVCESSKLDSIPVTNSGGETLEIYEARIEGVNQDDFSLADPFSGMQIEPDSTRFLKLYYSPLSIGDSRAELTLESNAYPDSILVLELTGRKDTLSLGLSDREIDLGVLCPGERVISDFDIINNGSLRTGGFIFTERLIETTIEEFAIDENEDINIGFEFIGTDQIGEYTEVITIVDSLCGNSWELLIKADIQMPEAEAEAIEILSQLSSSNTGMLSIENVSSRDLEITNITISDPGFEVLPNQLPLFIPSSETREIEIRYTPMDTAEIQAEIIFNIQPCDVEYEAMIMGKTVSSTASLRIGDISAAPGEMVNLPVYLLDSENLVASGATGFKVKIKYNGTLLYPMENTPAGFIENGERVIEFETGITPDNSGILERFPFIAMLGNATETAIALDEAEAIGASVVITKFPGSFSLNEVCEAGGTRLFDSEGEIFLSQNNPNPAAAKTEIIFEVIEDSYVELSIYDNLGEKVLAAANGHYNEGRYSIEIDLSGLSSGTYFYVLKSKTFILTKKMEVIK